jgi:hypothetical protein
MDVSVCVYSVFLLFCVYVAALRRADHSLKSSTVCVKMIMKLKKRPGATNGCRAVDEWKNELIN